MAVGRTSDPGRRSVQIRFRSRPEEKQMFIATLLNVTRVYFDYERIICSVQIGPDVYDGSEQKYYFLIKSSNAAGEKTESA